MTNPIQSFRNPIHDLKLKQFKMSSEVIPLEDILNAVSARVKQLDEAFHIMTYLVPKRQIDGEAWRVYDHMKELSIIKDYLSKIVKKEQHD